MFPQGMDTVSLASLYCEKPMKIEQLTSTNWANFAELMSADPQCSQCWCLNHREPSAGCPTGVRARARMKQRVELAKVFGFLACRGEECVGWVAIDPVTELAGHDCLSAPQKGEWSIHCVFVKEGHRGCGLSSELIRAAIAFGRSKGATLISAFPIPTENRSQFPEHKAEFSGRLSTYLKLGFKPCGAPSSFYQRVELILV